MTRAVIASTLKDAEAVLEYWIRYHLAAGFARLYLFFDDNVLAIYQPGTFGKSALTVCLKVFSMSPVTSYIAPVFIWILVMFRRDDVARFHATIHGEASRASSSHDPSR